MKVVQPTEPELTDMTKTQTMVSSLEKRLAAATATAAAAAEKTYF
jgi:hypothetical protein